MSNIPVDEPNDNLPCPDCGQDDCVCDPDFHDDWDDEDEFEEEDES